MIYYIFGIIISFNNCMEIKCIYTLETKSIEIFRSFDMIEDENYYIYAEEVWLDELKNSMWSKTCWGAKRKMHFK